MSDELVWYNGSILPLSKVSLDLYTYSLHYSGSVFEGIRIYDGKPFRLQEHIKRLLNTLAYLHYKIKYTAADLDKAVLQLLDERSLDDGYIRILVWKGGGKNLRIDGFLIPVNVAILVSSPFEARPLEEITPLRLQIAKNRRNRNAGIMYTMKLSSNYMEYAHAKNEALRSGFDDALFLDQDGNVVEATVSNFFGVCDGQLITPTIECALDGITRQTVCEIAKSASIAVHERQVPLDHLKTFQAAFLTGTAVEIAPVESIFDQCNNILYEFDSQNPLLRSIIAEYAKRKVSKV